MLDVRKGWRWNLWVFLAMMAIAVASAKGVTYALMGMMLYR